MELVSLLFSSPASLPHAVHRRVPTCQRLSTSHAEKNSFRLIWKLVETMSVPLAVTLPLASPALRMGRQ